MINLEIVATIWDLQTCAIECLIQFQTHENWNDLAMDRRRDDMKMNDSQGGSRAVLNMLFRGMSLRIFCQDRTVGRVRI
jgi:hypothetical protein